MPSAQSLELAPTRFVHVATTAAGLVKRSGRLARVSGAMSTSAMPNLRTLGAYIQYGGILGQ